MLDDLKNYRAADSDPFQIIEPDFAVFLICMISIMLYIFRDYL